ncbi:MAG: hypothetical protein ACD_39C01401G0002 [uncultured bacterium]|nr:MAG: hypothetical protein ACD_39C01401G0002 [uncultured bacterium]
MTRKIAFYFVLLLGFVIVGFPVLAQNHSGHAGHEKEAPAVVAQEKMPANSTGLPEKLVDVQYKVCPILGDETKQEIAVIFEGKVYHFCCASCQEAFKKDPKSVIPKIKDFKEVPLIITNRDGQCPVTSEVASGDLFLVRGYKITFYCCGACVGKDKLETDKPAADAKKPEEKKNK